MRRSILTMIIFIFTTISLFAQGLWSINVGVNFSSFINEKDYFICNKSFEINREVSISNNISIIPGMMISTQGSLLKNKPIKDWEYSEFYLYAYDIRVSKLFIEFPLLISYSVKLLPFAAKPYAGFSYRVGLGDGSKKFNRKLIYDDDHPERRSEFENYKYEYEKGDFEHGPHPIFVSTTGLGLNVGSKFEYKIIVIDFRYTLALHHIGEIDQVIQLNTKKKQTQTFHVLIGFKI